MLKEFVVVFFREVIKAWLMGMEDRLMTMRKTLKPISVGYLNDGQWIKPHAKTHGAGFEEDDEK